MVFITGQRATKIAQETVSINEHGMLRQAVVVIYQRYAHLFWIPLFPFARNYVLYLPDTNTTYRKGTFEKMPEPYLSTCKEVSKNARTPWWTFTGILLFALLIIWLERRGR